MARKLALVTGGARGIGEATARLLAEAGFTVGVYDLEVPNWCSSDDRFVPGILDVTDPKQWDTVLADLTADNGGKLDVLINNAGVLTSGPFVEGSYESDARVVDVNVKGVLYGCRAAYQFLKAAGTSTLVNVCSASAIYGSPGMATYSATKFAVRGITEALDQEWEGTGIRVTSVWPLYVPTALLEGVETSGMRTMGVRLTTDDVARDIAALVAETHSPSGIVDSVRGLLAPVIGRTVHRPVGRQASTLFWASQFTPGRITKIANRFLTT